MYPVFNIGPLAVQASPLIILLGLWLGLFLAGRYAKNFGSDEKILNNLVMITLISGIIGARLFYVIRYLDIFASNLTSVISPNPALFDPFGGIAAGLIAALLYGRYTKLNSWNTLDSLTPLLAVVAIAFPLAQFASGASYGKPAGLPWSIDLWGDFRHPVQLYNVMISFTILILIWPGWKFVISMPPGKYFLIFIVLTSLSWLFIEGFRVAGYLLPGGIRGVQVIFWITLAFALYRIKRISKVDSGNP